MLLQQIHQQCGELNKIVHEQVLVKHQPQLVNGASLIPDVQENLLMS